MVLTEQATVLLLVLIIWSLIWKAWATWRAARNNHLVWFIVLWIINTAGILEIIYIFFFSGYGVKKAVAKAKPAAKPKAAKKKK